MQELPKKPHGWKKGIMTKTIYNGYGSRLSKDEQVYYREYKNDSSMHHYRNLKLTILIRMSRIVIEFDE